MILTRLWPLMGLPTALAKTMELNMLLGADQCPSGLIVTEVLVTRNIVLDPVLISAYITASTALTIDSSITITVRNAPTLLQTVVTMTSTAETLATTYSTELAAPSTTIKASSSTTT